ncbi:MAG: Rrf2 family transcriptional regulator [Planctomycetes bacterium]|nr:Rrf2 family transcriptional regulator [Planctomycetota bacterium]
MLRFSRKADYGILLVADIAHSMDESPKGVSAASLAKKYSLSKSFTANILKDLSRGGILFSTRGKGGGYFLSKAPDEISLHDVVDVLDGGVKMTHCTPSGSFTSAEHDADADSGDCCEISETCPVRSPLQRVHRGIQHYLESQTFENFYDGSLGKDPFQVREALEIV